MKLPGLSVVLAFLDVFPSGASRRRDHAARGLLNLSQDPHRDGDTGGHLGFRNAAAFFDAEATLLHNIEATLLTNSTGAGLGRLRDARVGAEPDGEVTAKLERMEKVLMSARSVMASGAAKDSALPKLIKALQNQVKKEMMPQVLSSKNAAQTTLDHLYGAFKNCGGQMKSSAKGLRTMLNSRRAINRDHRKCRRKQARLVVRVESCSRLLAAEKMAKDAACAAFKAIQKNPRKEKRVCDEEDEDYGEWIRRITKWSAKEYARYSKYKRSCKRASQRVDKRMRRCNPFEKSHAKTKATCDHLQERLETTTCSVLTRTQGACQSYMPCYASAKATLDKQLPSIRKLERNRRATWRELKRMDCLLGKGCGAKSKEIKKCQKMKVNTKKLRLRYKKLPTPPKCKFPTSATCTTRYISKYYSGLPRKAPAKPCKSCAGLAPALPLPGGFKVRCRHDPAWSYVLDYSDSRSKDDIPNSRRLISKGFSNSNAFYIGNKRLEALDIEAVEMCALSSTRKTRAGKCQWSCKRLTDNNWAYGRCPTCRGLSSRVKKTIAGLSGQVLKGSPIVTNINPEIARFQDDMSGVGWNCYGHRDIVGTPGIGWIKNGWGISMRADHRAGTWEVGWYNNRCGYRAKLDVDTFQVRVQVKPKSFAMPARGGRAAPPPASGVVTGPRIKRHFGGARFGITRFRPRCSHQKGWVYVLDYSDDRNVDDIPSRANRIAKGFQNRNAYYIGNRKINKLKIRSAEMCILASTVKTKAGKCQWSCHRLTPRNWGGGKCRNCKRMKSRVKKMIAGLSGQMDSGNGKYERLVVNQRSYVDRFQEDYKSFKWSCKGHIDIVSWAKKGRRGWHKNGWGVGVRTDIKRGKEVGYLSNICGWQNKLDVDTFQIRVKI